MKRDDPNLRQALGSKAYDDRCPPGDAPVEADLLHHFCRLVDFTWGASAYAASKIQSGQFPGQVAGLVRTDIFLRIEICSKAADAVLREYSTERFSEIQKCLTGF